MHIPVRFAIVRLFPHMYVYVRVCERKVQTGRKGEIVPLRPGLKVRNARPASLHRICAKRIKCIDI